MLSDRDRLIARLREEFPDRAPSLGLSAEEVWFRAGQAHVVRFVNAWVEEEDRIQRGEETD